MSNTLSFQNFPTINLRETTQVDADVAASATTVSIPVKNSQDYASGDRVVIGAIGTESAEVQTVSSIPDATHISVGLLKFPHKRFDQITKLFGDQIRIYTAPNINGTPPTSFTMLLATISIDMDNQSTNYIDSSVVSGSESNIWYKYTYYNAAVPQETDLSLTTATRGGNVGNYCSIDDIRQEAGMQGNQYLTNTIIDTYRQQAQGEVNSSLSGLYTVPFASPVNINMKRIVIKIAAGLLLNRDYGPMSSGTKQEGDDKIKEGRDLLAQFQTKDLEILDANGVTLLLTTATGVFTWPNNQTASTDVDQGGADRNFRMGMIF